MSRIDLTHEYAMAAETFSLTYADLKEMARNSIEYSFLPGESLWRGHDYRQPQPVCAGDFAAPTKPMGACDAFLSSNPKAQQQWELEQRFQRFEQAQGVRHGR